MKNHKNLAVLFLSIVLSFSTAFSQEEAPAKSCETEVDLGFDLVSQYVWRGLTFGSGPAIQPYYEMSCNNFTLGTWSNLGFGVDNAFEVDVYASYSFPFYVNIGFTDYYFGGNVLGGNFDDLMASHDFEPFLEYEYGDLTFLGALMFVEEGEQDFYAQITYNFEKVDFIVGAGDGIYVTKSGDGWSSTGEFSFCNIGLESEKEIKITDDFVVPVKASVTLNPYSEKLYAYVAVSF